MESWTVLTVVDPGLERAVAAADQDADRAAGEVGDDEVGHAVAVEVGADHAGREIAGRRPRHGELPARGEHVRAAAIATRAAAVGRHAARVDRSVVRVAAPGDRHRRRCRDEPEHTTASLHPLLHHICSIANACRGRPVRGSIQPEDPHRWTVSFASCRLQRAGDSTPIQPALRGSCSLIADAQSCSGAARLREPGQRCAFCSGTNSIGA